MNYRCEDAPGFELLAPADPRRSRYDILELLAVMRSLRYNESFNSISFRNVDLTGLHGQRDPHGDDHVPYTTKSGEPINMPQQRDMWLLIQEIQALALKSKKLRRFDFTNCIKRIPVDFDDSRDIGCGICEAIFPLCARQLTNVDWITLNGIALADADIDYLYAAAINKLCHFRALDLGNCALGMTILNLHLCFCGFCLLSSVQIMYLPPERIISGLIYEHANALKVIEVCKLAFMLFRTRTRRWNPLTFLVIQHDLTPTF